MQTLPVSMLTLLYSCLLDGETDIKTLVSDSTSFLSHDKISLKN